MRRSLYQMLTRLLSLLLHILHQRLLLHDNRVQILEKLLQFNHRALDLLDRVVTLLHIAQRTLRLASPVRVEEGLLEYLRIAAIHRGFPHFSLGSFGVDDKVLSALLLLDFFSEIGFLRLIRIYRFAYPPIQRIDLGLIHRLAGVRLGFDALYAVREPAVPGHDVRAHAVDFFVRGAVAGGEAALDALELGEAVLKVVDCAAYGAAFVQDGVGVALLRDGGGGLGVGCASAAGGEGLHFYVVVLGWKHCWWEEVWKDASGYLP